MEMNYFQELGKTIPEQNDIKKTEIGIVIKLKQTGISNLKVDEYLGMLRKEDAVDLEMNNPMNSNCVST